MAYNKAKEEYRWKQWKSEEEKILREQGVDEETIQKLREYDWNDFNAERIAKWTKAKISKKFLDTI